MINIDNVKSYAYQKGFNDAKANKLISANPFPALSDHFYQWEAGFFQYILDNDCVMSA